MATATERFTLTSAWREVARARGREAILLLDAYGPAQIAIAEGNDPPEASTGHAVDGAFVRQIRGTERAWARGAGSSIVSTQIAPGSGFEAVAAMVPVPGGGNGLPYDDTALRLRISAVEQGLAEIDIPDPYDDSTLAARVTALESSPASGPTLTGFTLIAGLTYAVMSDGTTIMVPLPSAAATYPTLSAGMLRPGDITVAYSGSDPVLQITPSWFNGVATTGDPSLITWNDDRSVTLDAQFVGDQWHSGKTQVIKPQWGMGLTEWIASSDNPLAVLAMFLYDSSTSGGQPTPTNGTELDYEYITLPTAQYGHPAGTRGFLLSIHLRRTSGTGRRSVAVGFVPYTAQQWLTPTRFGITFDADRARWFIDGTQVAEYTRTAMLSAYPDALWTTAARLDVFTSVERHGSWAGWTTYTTASMRLWGVRPATDAEQVPEAPRRLAQATISPETGPVGTIYTVTPAVIIGSRPLTRAGTLTQAGATVANRTSGTSFTFTSTAGGSLEWSETATNSAGSVTGAASATIEGAVEEPTTTVQPTSDGFVAQG